MSKGTVLWKQLQGGWFLDVNRLARATPGLHRPLALYAGDGVALFAVLLLLSWWLARRDGDLRRVAIALWAPIGTLLALGVNQLLVTAVGEPRPYTVLPHVLVLGCRGSDYSFPSDHAVMAGAVAIGTVLAHRRLGLVTAALAVLMAFARVYIGVRFPLDVAAGLIVGGTVALLSYTLVCPLVRKLVNALARIQMRPLLIASSAVQR